ncbi:type II secretion system F family protein [Salimicrobium halophilum]|uniref:Type IV pilus assembly protein PilC n=1 Tax=Salimicrobium halophilum TaxID=86666 RepID=A0A1G8PJ70_9BACI|nr:type II secretion system F family protein [Salimicrobium halophilum]SDI92543.1 type IV pilus assembly protein PilC [Salimicrobium halophilum]
MAYFKYQGRNRTGKIVRGRKKAESEREVREKLGNEGIYIRQLEKLDSLLYKEINLGKRVKNQHFVLYLRQFSTLIQAGVSLVEATEILIEQTSNRTLKDTLQMIQRDIEGGMPFSDAAAKHDKVFPPMFIQMMRAGELSGNLDEALERMANYYEKQYELRQKIYSALTYPAVVGVIAFAIVVFMLTFIVPRFASMFQSFGSEVPPLTQFILSVGDLFGSIWWLIIFLPLLVMLALKLLERNVTAAYYMDYAKMKMPIFGPIVQKAVHARMARTLSSLFQSSVPVLQSVEMVQRVVQNKVIEEKLKEVYTSLERGESMATPLKNHWAFPVLVTQMITVGEKTGTLDQMFEKVAIFYENEIDHVTDRIKTLIEPVMIVVLSVIVGVIILAIAVPMFSLFEEIQ